RNEPNPDTAVAWWTDGTSEAAAPLAWWADAVDIEPPADEPPTLSPLPPETVAVAWWQDEDDQDDADEPPAATPPPELTGLVWWTDATPE
ncbi:MAG: hypothetical protein AAF907_01520, partial [Planctomycetota bacterium]